MTTSFLPKTMTATLGRTTLQSTLAGGTLDLLQTHDQTPAFPPPAFPPFRFEPRRARIDWRLLHGVDINTIVSACLHDLHVHAVLVQAMGKALTSSFAPASMCSCGGIECLHVLNKRTCLPVGALSVSAAVRACSILCVRCATWTWTPWKRL